MAKSYKRTHSDRVRSLVKKPCLSGKQRNSKTGYCQKISKKRKRSSSSSKYRGGPVAGVPRRNSKGRVILGGPRKKSSFKKKVSARKKSSARNTSISSCVKSKAALQRSVLRLAAKLSVYRSRSNAKLKKNIKTRLTKMEKKRAKATAYRSPSRSPTKAKTASGSKSRSRSKSLTRSTRARSTSNELRALEADMKARKAARVGKEDDWLADLARRHGAKQSDAEIQRILKLAEKDADAIQRAPAAPVVPAAVIKKRIAPTFLKAL